MKKEEMQALPKKKDILDTPSDNSQYVEREYDVPQYKKVRHAKPGYPAREPEGIYAYETLTKNPPKKDDEIVIYIFYNRNEPGLVLYKAANGRVVDGVLRHVPDGQFVAVADNIHGVNWDNRVNDEDCVIETEGLHANYQNVTYMVSREKLKEIVGTIKRAKHVGIDQVFISISENRENKNSSKKR